MPEYRVLLGDVISGELLAELPLEGMSYNHVLNEPGDAEITLGLIQPPDLEEVLRQTLVPPTGKVTPANAAGPGRATIGIERDGVIVWGGLVWLMPSVDLGEGVATLKAEGWQSYLRRRIIDEDEILTFAQVDQATIAKELVDYAQDSFWDTLHIDTSEVEPTGVLRDRTYGGIDYKNLGEALEQLAAVINGFDFRFVTVRDDVQGLHAKFLVDYPNTGRATGIVLVLGNQITRLSTAVDATQLATVAYGVGADTLRSVWHTPSLRGVYPRLDAVVSNTDVSVSSTLDGHTRQRLRRGRAPITLPTVEIDPGLQPPLGAYRVGDLVEVRGAAGWYSFSGTYRITKITVTVDTNGGEQVALELAQQEVFASG